MIYTTQEFMDELYKRSIDNILENKETTAMKACHAILSAIVGIINNHPEGILIGHATEEGEER
jgi:hypothetical protein